MPSYQYRESHCGDKTILRPSYLHNGISYTGKMASLFWIRALSSDRWPLMTVNPPVGYTTITFTIGKANPILLHRVWLLCFWYEPRLRSCEINSHLSRLLSLGRVVFRVGPYLPRKLFQVLILFRDTWLSMSACALVTTPLKLCE